MSLLDGTSRKQTKDLVSFLINSLCIIPIVQNRVTHNRRAQCTVQKTLQQPNYWFAELLIYCLIYCIQLPSVFRRLLTLIKLLTGHLFVHYHILNL